jgi:hypothetical protein
MLRWAATGASPCGRRRAGPAGGRMPDRFVAPPPAKPEALTQYRNSSPNCWQGMLARHAGNQDAGNKGQNHGPMSTRILDWLVTLNRHP